MTIHIFFYHSIFITTYKPRKLGQSELVFTPRSEFISRSVRAGLQISMCSCYICSTLVNSQTDSF